LNNAGKYQQGFTLLELITVLVLVSLLVAYTQYQSGSNSWGQAQASRDDLVAALFYAQQTAMAQDGPGREITFVAGTSSSICVEREGTALSTLYPLSLPTGVTMSVAGGFPLTLNYDKLGRTSATVITITSNGISVDVTVNGSGYAY